MAKNGYLREAFIKKKKKSVTFFTLGSGQNWNLIWGIFFLMTTVLGRHDMRYENLVRKQVKTLACTLINIEWNK